MKPPPLTFFWEIYEFFKAAEAAVGVCKKVVVKNFAIFTRKHL